MGYLTNSGTGFMKDAVTTVSNVKSYLVNKTGYLVDAIRVGIGDFGQRVLDDGGTVEASAEAAASYREITKNIYDQASLVLFPSGYKDNLLYSHKPVNGSGDFTYTRGTDTATRVGADGYIKKERANLLVQSNQFDTTWIVNTSVSEGEEGYDGTNDAWSLTRAAGGSLMARQENVTLSGVSTYSIYAKINTNNGIGLAFNGLSNAARFDLRDATKTQAVTETGIISSSQEYVGNGFYRLSITADVSGSTQLRIYLTTADATTSDGNGGTHIIQDAQIEQGLVPTSYIETTTAPVYEGLTDNLPRIDYTGGTPSILLEPSRTNEIGYSEYKASGDFTNSTPSYNAASSPEGLQNATEMFDNSTNGQHRVPIGSFAVTSGTDYTISAFVKNNDIGYCYLLLEGGFTQTRYYFNLSTGQPITSGLEVENFADGWYRIYVTQSAAASGTSSVYLNMSNNGVSPIYVGSNQSLYFYGLQAEQGSYPTSYIPTYNASATRTGEGQSSSDFSAELSTALSDAYTVFLDFEVTNNENTTLNFADIFNFKFDESLSKDAVKIETYHIGGVDSIRVFVYKQSSSTQAASVAPNVITMGSRVKLACVLDDSYGVKIFYNGTKIIDYQEVTAYEKTKFLKGSGVNGNIRSKTLLNKILAFSTALSEDDCEALTAL